MNINLHIIFANILMACTALPSFASESTKTCNQSENLVFITNDIFDLTDDESIFLHHWANFLHIKTKQKALINESAFFVDKCQIKAEDLEELERHFRHKKYIRNASVKMDENKKIVVETWDNWSLLPTVDFGRKGGKNKFAFGIKDRNLFGLGIDAEIEYFTNNQRSGYKLDTEFPLYLRNNINASIRLTDTDDGSSEAIFLQKKFVSFDTNHAFKIGIDDFDQLDTQFENGVESNRFRHKKDSSTASWQWLYSDSEKDTLRFGIGFTNEKHTFINVFNAESTSTLNLPTNREFNYPFISLEYLQKDYRKLTNLKLINQIEDFNLGWNFNANLGTDLSNKDDSPTFIWQSQVSKGLSFFENSYWFFNAEFEGEFYDSSDFGNRFSLQLDAEYFHKFNEQWGGYFQSASQFSQNQFLDSPVVLGGETGVRGYPLQYQHGESNTKLTFEARYYPHINIYKLLELGGAAFIDTGKIFNQSALSQQQSSRMTSIGLGARLYSTHSSEARVIHIDIIKPIASDTNVNSVEFRVTTKHSF